MAQTWTGRTANQLTGSVSVLLAAPLVVGAGISASPRGTSFARDAVPLTFTPPPADLHVALAILTANAKVAALPFLAAVTLSVSGSKPGVTRAVRGLFDALLTATATVNVVVLGVAIGGYGPARLWGWLLHWPAEAAGFAVAASVWLAARRRPLAPCELRAAAVVSLVLLAAAATIETYVPPLS